MLRRLTNLFRGFIGLFVSGLERRNPDALLELEKENLRRQMAQFNQGLTAHAALCEKLITQVRRLERQEQDIKAKAAAHLRAGNQQAAGDLALELQNVRLELKDNRSQLDDAEKTYKDLVASRDIAIKSARGKIEALKRGINDLQMQRALAEMNEMASGMLTKIGGSGDTLDRLQEMVEEERSKAAGKARVARDSLDTSEFQQKAAERQALQKMALADLAAELGMNESAAPATASSGEGKPQAQSSEPARSMGPLPE